MKINTGRFKKGFTPWNKGKKGLTNSGGFKKGHKTNIGRKYNFERNKKISLLRKGMIFSNETKKKMSLSRMGKTPGNKGTHYKSLKISKALKELYKNKESHPRWKGGITPINKIIRHSEEYRLWRMAVFTRDHFTCIWCGQINGYLEADHIKSFSQYPELRFAIDNGRTLCKNCHSTTDTYKGRSNKREISL